MEKVFWDNAAEKTPTKNIEKLLRYLKEQQIRTAVISNISFSGKALEERIHSLIPENEFEFILATSEYVFRKPHNRVFELALRKAKLKPNEVWYCGDNAYYDVEGALNMGIFPVWYTGALQVHNKQVPEMDCLAISDWVELMNYINKI
jgi:putative hydrolase of the HAD superfamily